MADRYHLYGLNVLSDIALAANAADFVQPDLTLLLLHPAPVEKKSAPGERLGGGFNPATERTSLTLDGDVHTLRFHGIAQFQWLRNDTVVRCQVDPAYTEEWASLFAASSFFAIWCGLHGDVPLHGSVVHYQGQAYGFLGYSGQGKTTLAHAACSAGAVLMSDDVLIPRRQGVAYQVLAGSLQLRLRPDSLPVIQGASLKISADNRHCMVFSHSPLSAPLAALIVPEISERHAEPGLRRLRGIDALRLLVSNPRAAHWQASSLRSSNFAAQGPLAESVPVFAAEIPTGLHRKPHFPSVVAHWLESARAI